MAFFGNGGKLTLPEENTIRMIATPFASSAVTGTIATDHERLISDRNAGRSWSLLLRPAVR
jgi:hypothetical protein